MLTTATGGCRKGRSGRLCRGETTRKGHKLRVLQARSLVERTRAQYERFVAFHADYSEAEALTLTLWTMHTHAFEAAEVTPYIAVMAPTPAAGKSRVIDIAQHLSARAWVVNDPSAASLFRKIEQDSPTLFIDEIDMLAKSQALKAVLNAGYRVDGAVPRSVKGVVHDFRVFCPKMFAGIAGAKMPIMGATLSRCIEFPMRRRLAGEPVERFYHRQAPADLHPIREELSAWAEAAVGELAEAQPDTPSELSDREAELWEPLLVIADTAGLAEEAREAAVVLSHSARTAPDPGAQIIADMARVWESIDGNKAHTAHLAELRNGLEDRQYPDPLTPHELSQWLGRFGVHPLPNPFRLRGHLARGYERSAFADAFNRYL
jgi:hypothetical protein